MMVKLRDRTFVITFFEDGRPRAIKERKIYAPGRPYEAVFNAPYWHHSHRVPKRGLVAEIFALLDQRPG